MDCDAVVFMFCSKLQRFKSGIYIVNIKICRKKLNLEKYML